MDKLSFEFFLDIATLLGCGAGCGISHRSAGLMQVGSTLKITALAPAYDLASFFGQLRLDVPRRQTWLRSSVPKGGIMQTLKEQET